jgi:predicted ATPase
MLRAVRIDNYRSVHHLELPLGKVTVLVGANGTGKTNCYRALQLAHAAARGRVAEHFAEEGGMQSAFWAGARLANEMSGIRLEVGVELDEFSYSLAVGLPLPGTTAFKLDAEMKEEDVGVALPGHKKPVPLCERRNHICSLRDAEGRRVVLTDPLDPAESVLSQIADPRQYGELALVRDTLARWRFYHQFRTDRDAPARHPRLGVRAPILDSDGANLAAALQTIVELDGYDDLTRAITTALPGHSLEIESDQRGRMTVALRQAGIHRVLSAAELSDGTLRYLCLCAALLSPRPPPFLALNEPETSLHPDLLPGLAGLIVAAGAKSQVLVTTHAQVLAETIAAATGEPAWTLTRSGKKGTQIVHQRGMLGARAGIRIRRAPDENSDQD